MMKKIALVIAAFSTAALLQAPTDAEARSWRNNHGHRGHRVVRHYNPPRRYYYYPPAPVVYYGAPVYSPYYYPPQPRVGFGFSIHSR